jgi:hypothetical protein
VVDGVEIDVNRILINVTYSYAVIVQAAESVQESDEWKEVDIIKDLKFGSQWVRCFLDRAKMKRRKITRDDKDTPTQAEVRFQMEIG